MASYVASYEFPRTRINNFFLIVFGELDAALRQCPWICSSRLSIFCMLGKPNDRCD
jgi:hypothetical protein